MSRHGCNASRPPDSLPFRARRRGNTSDRRPAGDAQSVDIIFEILRILGVRSTPSRSSHDPETASGHDGKVATEMIGAKTGPDTDRWGWYPLQDHAVTTTARPEFSLGVRREAAHPLGPRSLKVPILGVCKIRGRWQRATEVDLLEEVPRSAARIARRSGTYIRVLMLRADRVHPDRVSAAMNNCQIPSRRLGRLAWLWGACCHADLPRRVHDR